MQILHVHGDHWIAVSTVGCTANTEEDIVIYDSKYASLSADTKLLLSQLVHTDKPVFTVKIASVTKQSGSTDCGLFAIAYITSIAFDLDPAQYVFNQTAMRPHLQKCFEEKKITPFPVLRERRSSLTARTMCIKVYCYCRCIDTGEKMVICDGQCGEWFHTKCVDRAVCKKQKWFCKTCRVD